MKRIPNKLLLIIDYNDSGAREFLEMVLGKRDLLENNPLESSKRIASLISEFVVGIIPMKSFQWNHSNGMLKETFHRMANLRRPLAARSIGLLIRRN